MKKLILTLACCLSSIFCKAQIVDSAKIYATASFDYQGSQAVVTNCNIYDLAPTDYTYFNNSLIPCQHFQNATSYQVKNGVYTQNNFLKRNFITPYFYTDSLFSHTTNVFSGIDTVKLDTIDLRPLEIVEWRTSAIGFYRSKVENYYFNANQILFIDSSNSTIYDSTSNAIHHSQISHSVVGGVATESYIEEQKNSLNNWEPILLTIKRKYGSYYTDSVAKYTSGVMSSSSRGKHYLNAQQLDSFFVGEVWNPIFNTWSLYNRNYMYYDNQNHITFDTLDLSPISNGSRATYFQYNGNGKLLSSEILEYSSAGNVTSKQINTWHYNPAGHLDTLSGYNWINNAYICYGFQVTYYLPITLPIIPYNIPATVGSLTKNTSIIMYPNPASTVLNIESIVPDYQEKQIALLNSKGQLLQQFSCTEKKVVLDISDLNSGMYFLQVKGNATETFSFMKK